MVFEKCFLRGRYLIATSFIFLGLGALVARAAYVQSVNSETLSGEADNVHYVKMTCFLFVVQF